MQKNSVLAADITGCLSTWLEHCEAKETSIKLQLRDSHARGLCMPPLAEQAPHQVPKQEPCSLIESAGKLKNTTE